MARMISIHEYELKPGTGPERFEQTLRDAEALGLFDLPGLISHHFVKGVKGARRESQFLLPVLSTDPDSIRFTSYEELGLGAHEHISVKRATADED